ncbi:MAG: hypothetical protein HOV68_14370, partial [Streptomycetaceae bacterium]|nr:hypothetical protein [Streptomycetaceae bacterium]
MNSWPPGWAEEDGLSAGPRRDGRREPPPARPDAPDADPTAALPRDQYGRPIPPPGTLPTRPSGTLPASGSAGRGRHAAPPPGPDAQPTNVMPGGSAAP